MMSLQDLRACWRVRDGDSKIFSHAFGFEVSPYNLSLRFIVIFLLPPDAQIFYYLESWVASPAEPYVTVYLTRMEALQRAITTAAFKIAGGVDLSNAMLPATKPVRQNQISSTFVTKIVKAFLDALYAFLDGLVRLASDESPIVSGKRLNTESAGMNGLNPLQALDLTNGVRFLVLLDNIRSISFSFTG